MNSHSYTSIYSEASLKENRVSIESNVDSVGVSVYSLSLLAKSLELSAKHRMLKKILRYAFKLWSIPVYSGGILGCIDLDRCEEIAILKIRIRERVRNGRKYLRYEVGVPVEAANILNLIGGERAEVYADYSDKLIIYRLLYPGSSSDADLSKCSKIKIVIVKRGRARGRPRFRFTIPTAIANNMNIKNMSKAEVWICRDPKLLVYRPF